MKKKWIILSACVLLILAFAIGIYWYYHPTYILFNDRFVIGSTVDEIYEKYGEFSAKVRNDDGEVVYCAYKVRENTPELIMSYDNSLWYEIYFEDGIAVRVRLQEGWYGG